MSHCGEVLAMVHIGLRYRTQDAAYWIPLVFQIPQLKEGLVKHSQALFLANRTPAVPFSTPKHTKKNPYRPHLPTLHRGTTASTWQDSSSALHFAASGGFQDVVETLLEAASK